MSGVPPCEPMVPHRGGTHYRRDDTHTPRVRGLGQAGQYPGECATTFVVIVLGQALMPTAPAGPREDLLGGLLHREDQPPQEPPQFGDA